MRKKRRGGRYYHSPEYWKHIAKLNEVHKREGFEVRTGSGGQWYYHSEELERCECGTMPQIQVYIYSEERNSDHPNEFVVICPNCGLRAEGVHTPEECVEWWNKGRYSEISVLLQRSLKEVFFGDGGEEGTV